MMDAFRFLFPWALLLLLLVPWTIWMGARIQSLSPLRKWLAIALRTIILMCLVFALAGMELVKTTDDLAVFFLLDHSDSVPEELRLASAQWVRNAAEEFMTDRDKAGVIVFGREPSIELNIDDRLGLNEVRSYVDGEHTDLAAAMRLAMAAFPQGHMKRMVVYSDGNETLGTALEEAKLAQAAGIAVDVVPMNTREGHDVRLVEVSTPNRTEADEPFQLRIVASAEEDTPATVRVFQRSGSDRQMLPPQEVTLQRGDNAFVLTQELRSGGFYEYEVAIEAPNDSLVANNEGRAFTVVQGEPQVLVVESEQGTSEHLLEALYNEGLRAAPATPGSLPTDLALLQSFDAVVLADVSATDLTTDQMRSLEAMVRDLGVGLVMVGGPHSYGAGGYLDTPVEAALPVDMDIKQRKILPKGALALILHTVEFQDGNAWAREISLAALNVLASQDEIGMLGYEGGIGDDWIHELQPVGDKQAARRAIQVGSTRIGDMPDMGPTLSMALSALAASDAAAKRVIMISDGDPAAPTSALLQQFKDAGIAVSTVCINPHSPSDQNSLKYVAETTGGEFYFVLNAINLPQIFTKEAAVVKRGMFIEEPFVPEPHHDSELLYGLADSPMPELQGYVITSSKESATVPLLSHENDPVLAHWRYGLGKSVAFTSDATSRWATNWLEWDGFDRFWAQTVRWATRELTAGDFRVTTELRDGQGYVRIDAVDEDGRFINFLEPRGVVTGPAPEFERMDLQLPQTGPGIYEGRFPASEAGTYMINVLYENADGTEGVIPAGLAVSYSPEYRYTVTNLPLLEQLAALGGGSVVEPGANPFEHNLKTAPSITPIWPILVIVAVCLFPLEIFVRRVVVPFGEIYRLAVRAIRKIPGLGGLVPRPKPRPAVVTGAYYSVAAEEHRYETDTIAHTPSFAAEPGSATADEDTEPESEEPKPEAKPAVTQYTSQLLEAKERALLRKKRRLRDDDNQ